MDEISQEIDVEEISKNLKRIAVSIKEFQDIIISLGSSAQYITEVTTQLARQLEHFVQMSSDDLK